MARHPLDPAAARHAWRLSLGAVADLLRDAELLRDAGSLARARSLVIVAREQLGRAALLEREYAAAWIPGVPQTNPVITTDDPYLLGLAVEDEVAAFWGEASFHPSESPSRRQRLRQRSHARRVATRARMERDRGLSLTFLLDPTPRTVDPADLSDDMESIAQAAEMLMIRDHSRAQQAGRPNGAGDTTTELQFKLIGLAHPGVFDEPPAPPVRRSWWTRMRDTARARSARQG